MTKFMPETNDYIVESLYHYDATPMKYYTFGTLHEAVQFAESYLYHYQIYKDDCIVDFDMVEKMKESVKNMQD